MPNAELPTFCILPTRAKSDKEVAKEADRSRTSSQEYYEQER